MRRTFVKILYTPKLENPILVAGFPGIGDVGVTVAKMLVEFSQATLFGSLFSPNFQDFVFIDKNGVCHPPRYEFYAAKRDRDLIILTGDGAPSLEDIYGHFEVCGAILDFVKKNGCRLIIAVDGTPASAVDDRVFVSGTSEDIISKCVEVGATIYSNKIAIGLPGLLLGLAKKHGLEGVYILAPVSSIERDRKAAFKAYKFLMAILKSLSEDNAGLHS